jgi:nucleoside phosphorylase
VNARPTILVVTALSLEAAAVKASFDKYEQVGVSNDPHVYTLGTVIAGHGKMPRTVLLVCLSDMGEKIASAAVTHALRSFPSLEDVMLTGISGGCPDVGHPESHIRLGDLIISNVDGIVDYGDVKRTEGGTEYRGDPQKPSYRMLQCALDLESEYRLGKVMWEPHIAKIQLSLIGSERPPAETDILYEGNDPVPHPAQVLRRPELPMLHMGRIGSSDTLLKDPSLRDTLRDRFNVRAIEMEGSGVENATWAADKRALIVRSACDYCDSHKNKVWQPYAAVSAAAFTRAMIETIPDSWL